MANNKCAAAPPAPQKHISCRRALCSSPPPARRPPTKSWVQDPLANLSKLQALLGRRSAYAQRNLRSRGRVAREARLGGVWQGSKNKALKIKAERRVGSLGGVRQEPTRVFIAIWNSFGEPENPHEISRTLPRLFRSVGGLYFPQDHSQRRPETFDRAGHRIIRTASRTRWRVARYI